MWGILLKFFNQQAKAVITVPIDLAKQCHIRLIEDD